MSLSAHSTRMCFSIAIRSFNSYPDDHQINLEILPTNEIDALEDGELLLHDAELHSPLHFWDEIDGDILHNFEESNNEDKILLDCIYDLTKLPHKFCKVPECHVHGIVQE